MNCIHRAKYRIAVDKMQNNRYDLLIWCERHLSNIISMVTRGTIDCEGMKLTIQHSDFALCWIEALLTRHRFSVVADLGRGCVPCIPLSVQFISFSCSFGQKLCQIIGYRPGPREILDPPLLWDSPTVWQEVRIRFSRNWHETIILPVISWQIADLKN